MRRVFSLVLIFSLLNISFSDVGISFNFSKAEGIAGFNCNKKDKDGNVDESSCTFDATDKDGENIKDGWDVTFQQITLFSVVVNGMLRLGRCIAAAAAGCKCQGWSTATQVGAMATVLIGEIIELVKYEDIAEDLKREFDVKSIREKGTMCEDKSKKPSDMSDEEYSEFCDFQVKPIKRLISAYEAERSAASAKTWTYGIASLMTTAGMVLEIIAASIDTTEFIAENSNLGTVSGVCKAEAAERSAAGVAAPVAAATVTCCAAIVKQIVALNQEEITCKKGESLPNSKGFNLICRLPSIKREQVKLASFNTLCNPASCLSCQPFLQSLNVAGTTKISVELSLAIPGDRTCDVYTAPIANNSLPKENWLDPMFDKLFSYFVKKAVAVENNREGDHVARLVNVLVSTLGGAGAAAAFYATSWKSQDFFHKGPVYRAVFNGINTALLATSSGVTSSVADELDDKISKLNGLVSELKAIDVGESLNPTGDRLLLENDVGRDFDEDFLQSFDETFKDNQSPCAFGETPDGKGRCLSQDKAFAQTIDGLNLDGLVGQTTEEIRDFSNEISGKNKASEKLLALGKSLNAKRDPLKRILKKAKDDLNNLRGKNGLGPIDFDKEIANGVQRLQTALQNNLKEQGIPVASLKPAGSVATKKAKVDTVKKAKKKVAAKKDDKEKINNNGFAFSFDKKGSSNAGISDESLNSLREKTDKYKIDKGDISKRSKDDIFKMITTRYFKTALPVLVEEAN